MVIDNLTLAKEPNPWSVASLRNALSLFIDRQKIADGYGGTTIPSSTMFVEYGSMAPYIDALKSEGTAFPLARPRPIFLAISDRTAASC